MGKGKMKMGKVGKGVRGQGKCAWVEGVHGEGSEGRE